MLLKGTNKNFTQWNDSNLVGDFRQKTLLGTISYFFIDTQNFSFLKRYRNRYQTFDFIIILVLNDTDAVLIFLIDRT